MSTAVLCNTLVTNGRRWSSHLFVGLRDHYSQDTPANRCVRSVEEISAGNRQNRRESRFNGLTNHLFLIASRWARTNIGNNGRPPGPILQERHCADKQRRAGRSWF